MAEGAELVVDGRPFVHPTSPDGFFLGVSLFDHVTPEMEIYQEEIFGPVLGIVRAKTYDEAIGLINAHKYANGTAIFTTDGGAARRFKLEVDVPMIGVNVPIPVPAGYLSFGGAKESAIGDLAMRGEDGVRFFTQQKMVTERWPEPGRPAPSASCSPATPDGSPFRSGGDAVRRPRTGEGVCRTPRRPLLAKQSRATTDPLGLVIDGIARSRGFAGDIAAWPVGSRDCCSAAAACRRPPGGIPRPADGAV